MPASRNVDEEEVSEEDEDFQEEDEDEDRDEGRGAQNQSKKRKGSAFIDDAAEEDDDEEEDEVCFSSACNRIAQVSPAATRSSKALQLRAGFVQNFAPSHLLTFLHTAPPFRRCTWACVATGGWQRQTPQEKEHIC